MNSRQNHFLFARNARIYRRSALGLIGLGLVPPLAFTTIVSSRGQRAEHEGLPTVQVPLLHLPSIHNFRDVAGVDAQSPYRNVHGVALRTRTLYRSGWISADDADAQRLRTLGVDVVYDLRPQEQRDSQPDRVPQGAEYVPLFQMGASASAMQGRQAAAPESMEERMRFFVSDQGIRTRTVFLLEQMALVEGAQVFHCVLGCDLTGWVTALLHTIAELPQDVIMQDYLLSNERLKSEANAEAQPAPVQASYLQAALHEATARHGSVQQFINEGLRLGEAAQQRLRGKLLMQT
ncbi:tyrosine-protein phosphatase [Diaphorobacter caeni]|uniref:tyrosine-protein phosphatase n=1 Tax=Diaphorobacter caeni TaxID=2784387 RepID=UPI0018905378|nr:tyrosine-protein phosphatase [Diaphorobacter caeni]MBF5003061.1 tyrosine-protein phosphatase [Diaphorobacter caeni]